MPKKRGQPLVRVRHQFTGQDQDDVQLGLRLWAAYLGEEIRKRSIPLPKQEWGRPG